MKRYNTISCIPGLMKVVDYEEPVVEKSDVPVVDKKYFVPLSEQRNAVFRALTERDKARFSFPDGNDDGRDVSMKRRGLDLAEVSTNLNNVRDSLSDRYKELDDKGKVLQKVVDRKARERVYKKQRSQGGR